jgi:hypothetical protein
MPFLHNSPKVSLFIDLEETHDDYADRASEHQPEQKEPPHLRHFHLPVRLYLL